MHLVLRLAISAAIATVTLVACAGTAAPSASSPTAGGAANAGITIKGFAFSPASLSVSKGTKLTITNQDSTTHTFTSGANRTKDGKFDEQLSGGNETTITLDTAGTIEYFCQFHSSMKGTITVK